MQTPILLVVLGVALFVLALAMFRRNAAASGPIWSRGSGWSRLGLLSWWLSLAALAAGLVFWLRLH